MINALRKVAALQTSYSPENTPEMQERGVLIRRTIPNHLRAISAELKEALGPVFGNQIGIGFSDGIGRKTHAPWVRIFATSMSPKPTEGWYVVVHFAANGLAMLVTVGCGSTVWSNGSLKSESPAELTKRT